MKRVCFVFILLCLSYFGFAQKDTSTQSNELKTVKVSGKRKKPIEGEFKEATSTSSNSIYDANSFEDINMNGNKLKGSGRSWKKTQIPGGSYVEIDKKCKTFH